MVNTNLVSGIFLALLVFAVGVIAGAGININHTNNKYGIPEADEHCKALGYEEFNKALPVYGLKKTTRGIDEPEHEVIGMFVSCKDSEGLEWSLSSHPEIMREHSEITKELCGLGITDFCSPTIDRPPVVKTFTCDQINCDDWRNGYQLCKYYSCDNRTLTIGTSTTGTIGAVIAPPEVVCYDDQGRQIQ